MQPFPSTSDERQKLEAAGAGEGHVPGLVGHGGFLWFDVEVLLGPGKKRGTWRAGMAVPKNLVILALAVSSLLVRT